jgi:hypothetical protein
MHVLEDRIVLYIPGRLDRGVGVFTRRDIAFTHVTKTLMNELIRHTLILMRSVPSTRAEM